jgi:hypothetical protein
MSKTTIASNQILDYHIGRSTPAAITPYLGLLTAVETPAEPSGNGYVRVPIGSSQFGNAAASGLISNTAAITFAQATGSWGDIIGFGIWDAVSSGNLLRKTYAVSGAWFTFTALTSDTFTAPSSAFSNTNRVVLIALAGTIIPTGSTQGTLYYVISASSDTFQISLTSGGAAVNITANGGGRCARVIPTTVGSGDIPSFAIASVVFSDY